MAEETFVIIKISELWWPLCKNITGYAEPGIARASTIFVTTHTDDLLA